MSIMTKVALTTALAATGLTVAAPASADRYRHYNRGGDVATGAIVGGIVGLGIGAAIASSNRGPRYNGGYYNRGYAPRGYYRQRYVPRRAYYRPRCYTQVRFDPYYGRVPVRVCR